MKLEDVADGGWVKGVVPGESVQVVGRRWSGADALALTYERANGDLARVVLYRSDEPRLQPGAAAARPYDALGADFRLVAEAQRIRLAGLHDPMLAIAASDVQPLPHQIRAVYGEMLPRSPLRFLLADDPGAGKTIMAGLLVKELSLREDVKGCLIVAPGGLVEQWQDELWTKFAMRFELLSTDMAEAQVGGSVFDTHPRLIARMDQLARNDDLLDQLDQSAFDLVVVDEAHRMSAHWFGGKVERSKRFLLGERLGRLTRHLLLMTATPHAGKDDDFQLFLSLLDRDRFEGRARGRIETADVMRRMIKEDLLTFDGRPLFPERVAQTVEYHLSPEEAELYELVSDYVRHEMDRAKALDGKRRNTVGFALTVLQRRLASSPEAIYQSLVRRVARLERRRADLINGVGVREPAVGRVVDLDDLDDLDEYTADDIEDVEEELVDAATAARTVEELDHELASLVRLVDVARRVRNLDTDRKWVELRTILENDVLGATDDDRPRKLIVFTEHRDTLEYLRGKITSLLGRSEAVEAIHGGVRRETRRQITAEFTHNPRCRVLLATDAAGEGLNLQAAHMVVNYDLPWNPNRIEQRFGRVHRIGQREVCRLWNLVAVDTREGAVFQRLLLKIEEQRRAYGGRVFDVLGHAFGESSLRELLMDAVLYGEQPEVRARMEQVIDASVAEGLAEVLAEGALAREAMPPEQLAELRQQMEDARARRLQPHFIQQAFTEAFRVLGGRMSRREAGRYEISHVPARIRQAARGAVATRYERVAFELDRLDGDGLTRAELLAPGHPLHDAVLDEVLRERGDALERGAVLVSAQVTEPTLLVGVVEQVVDAAGVSQSKRFGYAFVGPDGSVRDAGPAPYLDCVPAHPPIGAVPGWVAAAETAAIDWLVSDRLPDHLAEVSATRIIELERVRAQVTARMNREINRLAAESGAAAEKVRAGQRVRETPDNLDRRREDLEARLDRRLALLERELQLSTVPPRVVAAALVLPAERDRTRTRETAEVERRAVDAVLAAEQALGRRPQEMHRLNPGYDIVSRDGDQPSIYLEVKGRIAGADDVTVSHTEIRHGQNAAPHHRLAIVRVDPRGPEHDEVRYVADAFADVAIGLDVDAVTFKWNRMWSRGREPF